MRQLVGTIPGHFDYRIRAYFHPDFATFALQDGYAVVAYHNRTTDFNIPKQSCLFSHGILPRKAVHEGVTLRRGQLVVGILKRRAG